VGARLFLFVCFPNPQVPRWQHGSILVIIMYAAFDGKWDVFAVAHQSVHGSHTATGIKSAVCESANSLWGLLKARVAITISSDAVWTNPGHFFALLSNNFAASMRSPLGTL
jgi:hypothetical protein